MNERRVRFPCNDISLEGVLGLPEGEGQFPAVAICHPHPQYGGSMNNNVVYAACAALSRESIAWLRFNFRGVGRSEGYFADGIGEQDDVKAALAYLTVQPEIDPNRLGLCGYSFGTMVSIPVADADERVQALAAISPFFVSEGLLQHYTRPKLFICGGNDDFIAPQTILQILEGLPEPKRYEVIPNADHFWSGFESQLEAALAPFFTSAFKEN